MIANPSYYAERGSLYIDNEFDVRRIDRELSFLSQIYLNEKYKLLQKINLHKMGLDDDNSTSHVIYEAKLKVLEKTQPLKNLLFNFRPEARCKDILQMHKNIINDLKSKAVPIENLNLHILPNEDCTMTPQELELVVKLDQQHKKMTGNTNDAFFVGELLYDEGWPLSRIVQANSQIHSIVEKIKDLSPLEKISYVYSWLTERVYNGINDRHNSSELVGALTSNKIICLGFTKIFLEVMKQSGIVGLSVGEGKRTANHSSSLLYVKDSKYGVDGYYYFDPCWDSKYLSVQERTSTRKQHLRYFAIPPQDVPKIKRNSNVFDYFNYTKCPILTHLYDIEGNSAFFFPNKEDENHFLELCKESEDNYFDDDENMLSFVIEQLELKYGPRFYNNQVCQNFIKETAAQAIESNKADARAYDLNRYFHPEAIKQYNLGNEDYSIMYRFYEIARTSKAIDFYIEKFANNHPNFESKPIDKTILKSAYEVAEKKRYCDMQTSGTHCDKLNFQQEKLKHINASFGERQRGLDK